jgi:hypothetical protein
MTASQPLPAAPFGDALRTAVRCRGLTLDRIRYHLARRGVHVGLSSLSDWQHGRSLPASAKSLRAVRELEEILDLAPESLSRLLTQSRRPPSAGLDESRSPLAQLLHSVRDTTGAFDMLTRSCRTVVDARRRASLMRDHTVIRARRDGLDRYVMRYIGDPGCAIDQVRFTRLDNCRLGRVVRVQDPREPALVAELIFDRPLAAGETWVFDTEMVDDTGEPCADFAHAFRQPVNQLVLEIQFDPAVDPRNLHTFAEQGLNGPRTRMQDLQLNAHRMAHVVASEVRTGVVGIAWSWDDEVL